MTMPWPRDADSLVFVTTNVTANWLALELADLGVAFVEIGGGLAPRQAPYAFYEGRRAGMKRSHQKASVAVMAS